MKRPKFVLLDAVHTLMDLAPDFPGFFRMIARREGLEPDPEALREAFAEADRQVRARLEGRSDWSIDLERERLFWSKIDAGIFRRIGFAERAEEMAAKAFAEFNSGAHFHLFGIAEPALQGIRALDLPMGIVSNGTDGMERWMKASPLADYAEFILVSAVVGWEKPGPEIFRLALEQAGAAPHEALFVGDSFEHDVLGALGVGIPAIWLSKNPDGRAKGLPPSQFSVLEHIGQLPDFLARLAPQGKECGSLA